MQSSRPFNRRQVLETIRLHGPLSRADLARRTGLTNQTVANLVELLVEEGLVEEVGRRALSRGQPARDLALRPLGALAAGFHLDRRAWAWTVSDLSGAVRARREGSFEADTAPSDLVPLWSRAWSDLRASFSPEAPFCGVGVAGPGPQDEAGVLRSPPGFDGWDGFDLKSTAEAITGLEARVENDARAAAVGELWGGHGRQQPDFLYLYCSWGFGLGVVLDGALRRGEGGRAGEIVDLYPWTVGEDPDWATRSDQLGPLLGVLVRALAIGAVVVGGPLSRPDRARLAEALSHQWPRVPVLVSELDDAASVGAAALVLTRRFEGW